MRPSHYRTRFKDRLTPRQHQVADLLAHGKTNAEIAIELNLGWETVKSHVSEILVKLDADSREIAAERWRRDNAIGAAIARPFRAMLALAPLRWIGVGTAVVVGAVAAAALMAIALSGTDSPGEVAPPGLTAVPQSAVYRLSSVPACCVAHQVTVAGGDAWVVAGTNVTNWQSQLLRAERASTGLARVDLGVWPLVVAGSGKSLWMSRPDSYDFDKSDREANRVIPGDAGDASRITAIDVSTLGLLQSFSAPARVSQLAADGQYVWAISDRDQLVVQFDAASGIELNRWALEAIGQAAIQHSDLWITLPKAGSVVRLNSVTGAVDAVGLPGECGCGVNVAATHDAIWVALFARHSLARIDASDPANVVEIPMVLGPSKMGVGEDGSFWVILSGLDGMTLVQLEPSTGDVLKQTELGQFEGSADGLAVTSDAVWITGQKGEVVRVDR